MVKSALFFSCFFLAAVVSLDLVNALSSIPHPQSATTNHLQQRGFTAPMAMMSTRGAFFAGAAFVLVAPTTAALAASVPDGIKGTKEDPAFQACLSKCVYECTKPKGGSEQRLRAECLPECKQKCATTKEQLLKGTAIKKT